MTSFSSAHCTRDHDSEILCSDALRASTSCRLVVKLCSCQCCTFVRFHFVDVLVFLLFIPPPTHCGLVSITTTYFPHLINVSESVNSYIVRPTSYSSHTRPHTDYQAQIYTEILQLDLDMVLVGLRRTNIVDAIQRRNYIQKCKSETENQVK